MARRRRGAKFPLPAGVRTRHRHAMYLLTYCVGRSSALGLPWVVLGTERTSSICLCWERAEERLRICQHTTGKVATSATVRHGCLRDGAGQTEQSRAKQTKGE
ncbi:hypothetical protein F5B19DRAFT_469636 [Rostrohypoxylon terebratum]|nr:hypothetical protein F5B19DRAFT_469636 [Rostrohypoxylon terebratum]